MGREQPVLGARGESLHPRQWNANRLTVWHEGRSRFIHRRRQQLQPEPVTFEHIDEWMIETLAVRQHAGHELGGMVSLEPGRLIRFNGVGGGMCLVERIPAEASDQFPHLRNLRVVMTLCPCRGHELPANLGHDRTLLLHECATQHIRPARRNPGERFADLEDVFLIHHESIRAAQARLQGRMRIRHWFHALIAPGERELLGFVRGTRSDDGDNRHQPVDLPDVRHPVQRRHRGALDVMNRSRSTAGNHLPHVRIVPRFQLVEIHRDPSLGQRPPRIAHHRQTALRENVHLHEADFLHGIHVEMCGCEPLVGNERGRQFVHRLAGQHHAARVHLRVAWPVVEERRHLDGRAVRLLVHRQTTGAGIGPQQFHQTRAALGRGLVRYPAAAEAPREMLGELAHVTFSHAQHLRDFRESRAGLEGREASDHRAPFRPILGEDEPHHVVLPVMWEINIDVRQLVQRHPLRVEEAFEVKIEADRAHV